MGNLIKDMLKSLFRALLHMLVGALVVKKLIPPELADQFLANPQTELWLTALAASVVAILWSLFERYRRKLTYELAKRMEANVSNRTIKKELEFMPLEKKKELLKS